MDVTCEKCRTEYEFDESLISESGTTVKCTNCGHLFRIYRPGTPESKRKPAWLLKQPDGSVYTFERMSTLRRWIAEGKVSRDDVVSRDGEGWQKLGDMEELRSAFENARAALAATADAIDWGDEGPTIRRPSPRQGSESLRVSDGADARVGSGARVIPPPPRPPVAIPSGAMPVNLSPQAVGTSGAATPPSPPGSPPGASTGGAPTGARPSAQSALVASTAQNAPAAPSAGVVPPGVAAPPAPEPPPAHSHGAEAPAPPPAPPPAAPASWPSTSRPEGAQPGAPPAVSEPQETKGAPAPQVTETTPREASSPSSGGEGWAEGALLAESEPAWASSAPIPPPPSIAPSVEQQAGTGEEDDWSEGRISTIPRRRRDSDPEDWDGRSAKGSRLRVALPVGLILLVVVLAGGLYLFRPDLFQYMTNQILTREDTTTTDANHAAYLRGREYFLLDTEEGFAQADREYHRAPTLDGLIEAGLAEVYTTWAQYYLDEVADRRLEAREAEPTKAAKILGRADVRYEEAQEKLEQARRFVDAALKKAPDAPEVQRSAADYYRLTGRLDEARQHVEKALAASRGQRSRPETEYVAALVELARSGDLERAIASLERVVSQDDKLLRCQYRLARLLGAKGQRDEAREHLEKILAVNEEHLRARKLLDQLGDESHEVYVAVTSVTLRPHPEAGGDAGPDGGTDAAVASEAGTPDSDVAVAAETGPPDAGPALAAAQADAEPSRTSAEGEGGGEATASAGSVGEESFDALVRRATKAQSNGSREACALFRRAERIRSGHPEVMVGLGYCAADAGNRTKAISYYQRALQANRGYGPALLALASAYRSQGNKRQALETYRQYLRFHSTGAQAGIARRNIARLEEELGLNEPETSDRGGVASSTRSSSGPSPAPTAPPGGSSLPAPGSTTTHPPTSSPPPPQVSGDGTSSNPTVIRITGPTRTETHSDSLATDSEPPLRPGENVE